MAKACRKESAVVVSGETIRISFQKAISAKTISVHLANVVEVEID
jgi:hypothetical protein